MDPLSSLGHDGPSGPAQSPETQEQHEQQPSSPSQGHFNTAHPPQAQGQLDQSASSENNELADSVQSPPAQGEPNQPPSSLEHSAPVDPTQSPQTPLNLPSPDRLYCIRDSLSPEIYPMVSLSVNRPRDFAAVTRFYDIQQQQQNPLFLAPPILLPFPPLPKPIPSYKHPCDEYDSDLETYTYRKQDKENNREPKRRRFSALAVLPWHPSVLSTMGSAVENVVQTPDTATPHDGHSIESHHIPLPESVLQPTIHEQSLLPPPVSVPGLMGPPPLPAQNRKQIQEQAWAVAKAQAQALTQSRAQAQELAQAQEPPQPTLPMLQSRLIRFLDIHGGIYEAEKLRVFICVRKSSVAENLYSIFADFSNARGLEGVKHLDIKLDWAWTQGDLERLAAAARGCRFNTLTINGGDERPQLHHRTSRKAATTTPVATLFDPLIQLFGFKSLTCIHLESMPDCLQEFSVDFPADLSHLETLQIHFDIFNWNSPTGQKFFNLAKRLSHIKLLIVECPLADYRAYLMNIWLGLMAPSAAPTNKFSIEPPSQDIQVKLLSRGTTHVTAVFRRQGAVPESLIVDLGFVKEYEVTWEYLLDTPIAKKIHTFRLEGALTKKWIPFVLKWLASRQQQPSSLSSTSSNSTELAPATTTTNSTSIEYVCLRKVSLCCSRLRADSKYDLIELIKLATSPTLGLQRLCLIELRLPLDPPEILLLGDQNGSRSTWSKLFINHNLWNLEELEFEDSNFGDIHVEGFLFFMANMKKLEDNEKTKRMEQEERRKRLELGLITLEDGELEEDEDDDDIVKMRLKFIRFKNHRLTPEAESCMLGRLQDMDSSLQVYFLMDKK
ncbi:hypothetical protein F5H01DRAFT_412958 [Linnemannia elongata]|nr:hypothetical protein F5H01DRAFT_412958 [Linnemannia elongata]